MRRLPAFHQVCVAAIQGAVDSQLVVVRENVADDRQGSDTARMQAATPSRCVASIRCWSTSRWETIDQRLAAGENTISSRSSVSMAIKLLPTPTLMVAIRAGEV